jgi:hypothetical protein
MISVTFQTDSKNPTSVVGRIEDGRLAFINPHSKREKPKPGEVWSCEIVKEEKKYLWVNPVKKVVSEEVAQDVMRDRLADLRKMYPSKKDRR